MKENMKSSNTTNTQHSAQRIERLLKDPRVISASDLLSQEIRTSGQPCRRGFGENADFWHFKKRMHVQDLISRSIVEVHQNDLRNFLASVLSEPDVLRAITSKSYAGQKYPIELMCRASRIARSYPMLKSHEREVLHVVILLAGMREVIAEQHPCELCSANQVLFAIVCPALHRLQDIQPEIANVLRMALDWGCEVMDESPFTQWVVYVVERTLQAVGMSAQLPCTDALVSD